VLHPAEEESGVLQQGVYGPVALHASGRIGLLSAKLETGIKARLLTQRRVETRPTESPLERYTRLTEEVRTLHEELSAVAATDEMRDAEGAVRTTTEDIWTHLSKGTQTLQEQLFSIAPLLAAALRSVPCTLAVVPGESWYAAALAQLGHLQASAASETMPLKTSPEPAGVLSSVTAFRAADLLDARISALEALLLGQSVDAAKENPLGVAAYPRGETGSSTIGLVARLDALDSKISLLQPQALTDLTVRATGAVAALKQLQATATHALGTSASSSSHGFIVTNERAMRSIRTLEQCDAAAAALPVLTSRLATLDGLHRDAAFFTQRLALAENAVGAIDARLDHDEAMLAEMRSGIQSAAETMAHNVRELQTALQGVPGRT
jgi:hypothetical protein